MKIVTYDFSFDQEIIKGKIDACQKVIDDNLEKNGGTLKKADLLKKDLGWRYLVTAEIEDVILGFALIREATEDKHKTSLKSYYYLSQIAVYKKIQKHGIGTALLNEVITLTDGSPLVASCLKDNVASQSLLGKMMKIYNQTKNYYRYIDNATFDKGFDLRNKKI